MWQKFLKFRNRWNRQDCLRQLGSEIAQNLERCYVMRQLDQLRPFTLEVWKKGPSIVGISWPEEILSYARNLEEFNQALRQAQEYENWYKGDMSRQNQETARVLHDRKEFAREKFLGLEPVIKAAQAAFKDTFNF